VTDGSESSAPRVVHADASLVVVDKPSGVPSVPARTRLDPPDVAVRLAGTFGSLEAVHRLDRDTSGLLVLARSQAARAALGRAFERGDVSKAYLAVVRGIPPRPSGELHLPLAPDPDAPPRQRPDLIRGRRAATRWMTLAEANRSPDGCAATLLRLEPLTGRSHQLRVHLAWLGCPILGDRLYDVSPDPPFPLALHAARLDLPHPEEGTRVVLEAAAPSGPPWRWFGPELSPLWVAVPRP